MLASVTFAGTAYPLIQCTLRREQDYGTLDIVLAGNHAIAVASTCVLSTSGAADISGTVASVERTTASTAVRVDLAASTGSGQYAPAKVQYTRSGAVRADLSFSVLPGDTYNGTVIDGITSTLGASSPSFTEVRF